VKVMSNTKVLMRWPPWAKASIRLVFCAFTISETCYRYESKLQPENEIIADRLIKLTQNQINWGFGTCNTMVTLSSSKNIACSIFTLQH